MTGAPPREWARRAALGGILRACGEWGAEDGDRAPSPLLGLTPEQRREVRRALVALLAERPMRAAPPDPRERSGSLGDSPQTG